MRANDQIIAWFAVADQLQKLLQNKADSVLTEKYSAVLKSTESNNPWFTQPQIETALQVLVKLLSSDVLSTWPEKYNLQKENPKRVGVIMAGNIPLAGFHDFLCVLLSGNYLNAKLSGGDKILLPFIADLFTEQCPEAQNHFQFVDQLKNSDAVIATGSNNTGRYFEYYFGKQPHIFRKNRNSAAILNGNENEFDFLLLGRDIFTYFGLGCRNVSKLYVPEGYKFDDFFQGILPYSHVLDHNKYMNNVDYHQALYLLNQDPFLTNNFLIVIENNALASPVGVLHYETYKTEAELNSKLKAVENDLQCVVGKHGKVPLGQAQFPAIDDFADGVDTMAFLVDI